MIHKERIHHTNDQEIREGEYVTYWMQTAQRTRDNHALEYAIEQSNRFGKPLLVYFGLTPDYPEAGRRHYAFMLQGLQEVREELAARGIAFLLRLTSPEKGALEMAKKSLLLVTEKGYTRLERRWREHVAAKAPCPVVELETNLILPSREASIKQEYSAATFRRKIAGKIPGFAAILRQRKVRYPSLLLQLPFPNESLEDISGLLLRLGAHPQPEEAVWIQGGYSRARAALEEFLEEKLPHYALERNQPSGDYASGLSPYLHFGQISPLEIWREVSRIPGKNAEAFLEELVVRRELSFNYVLNQPLYDAYEGLPQWARASLEKHAGDPRPILYSKEELEGAATHDPYWNAAQRQLLREGRIHNYMRMYWGKKILEWSTSAKEAFETALDLNNRYAIDGRDPNSFAGVAWCFGLHDRPWQEREIFGMIRYMNDKGLERKFQMAPYLEKYGE